MNKDLSLIEPGILNIGVDASAPLPLHSDPNLPDFEGFEVDLIKSVAAQLGVSVHYKNALWSKLIDDLLQGRIDMICTAATITEERKGILDFSQPYLDIKLALVTRKGSPIKTLPDIRDHVVGVRVATSAEDFIRRHAQIKSTRAFDMNTEAYKTLQAGEVDAVIDDLPIARAFATSTPGLELAGTIPGTNAQYAMMFRKGNDGLRRAVDDALAKLQADGTYAEISQKWLNQSSAAFPGQFKTPARETMIARSWHGRVPRAKAEAYYTYLLRTGLNDYRTTPGNLGVSVFRRNEGDITHYLLTTLWESYDAIRAFAGPDYERARYYPEDDEYLLEREPFVTHYEVLRSVRSI